MKNLFFTILILGLLISENIYSQSYFDCGTLPDENSNNSISSPFEGLYKPNRTDTLNGVALPEDAFFPVIVVFGQFKNEASDPRHTWDTNSAPIYLDSLISRTKKSSGNWWNFYDPGTEILSSHWIEISRGKLHVVSPQGAFSVVLSQEASYYAAFGLDADTVINAEIWQSLNSQGLTDWLEYDRWKKVGSQFEFCALGEGDSLVDMIYKVHKSRNNGGLVDVGGFAQLSSQNPGIKFLADTLNQIKIDYGSGHTGSGLTVSFRGLLAQYLGTIGHEHGHYMINIGHSTYSRVSYGFGYDHFYSPADMILSNYMAPRNATINSTNTLGDYSSRNSGSGEILKIPVQGNEFFLLVSRNKVSKWDRVMIGDVASIDDYRDNSDYGKGLYIYHVPNGLDFTGGNISQQDMECADGLFQFEYAGQSAQQVVFDCFISGSNHWYYYNKKKVIYENDSSNLFDEPPANYTFRSIGDGISFRNYIGVINGRHAYRLKWWGEGKQPTNPCNIGTDRISTNIEEPYTRFDVGGDRWDPWKPGYNEVFSPYSSPNTNTWTTTPSNQNSGIFFWFYTSSISSGPSGLDYIKIYKAGTGGFSEDSILHLTPPSRPMGLIVMPCDSQPYINSYYRIKLKWNHNMEPDMLPAFGTSNKKYKVYRNYTSNMETVPQDAAQYSENYYTAISMIVIHKDSTPYFIDSSFISECHSPPDATCPPICWTLFPVRYRVQAIDRFNDQSVLSDFASTKAWNIAEGEDGEDEGPDNILHTESKNIPKEYALKQNYPNPFNPSTNIQYDLPRDNFVSIKIYNILGKEILILVNEFKEAGSYLTSFNGSNLPSGIYYYKIKAGAFEQVKKMILIK